MTRGPDLFAPAADKHTSEEGDVLTPRFDKDGLIPCIATDASSGEVLMFAWMNAEALDETLRTRRACYYSRSRGTLWRKGEESGNRQRVVELRIDCDQDAVWIRVATEGSGAACHTGRRSCFYRAADLGGEGTRRLKFVGGEPLFDPEKVYRAKE